MHIGITRGHSPKKSFVPTAIQSLRKVRRKRSGDGRSCERRDR
jgi:hypothetical protein